jgi:hypothetical protein
VNRFINKKNHDTRVSHNDAAEDSRLLECCVTSTGVKLPTFLCSVVPSLSVSSNPGLLESEDEGKPPFETSVIIYQSTRHNIPQDLDLQQYRCENLEPSVPVPFLLSKKLSK